jgi:ATP-binding cassette subfamily B multidrug efflux pump
MADAHQEEEVLGKAYDSRLMKRLLTYLAPYKWQTVVALIAILIKAGSDVLGPYLTKVAIDKYLASSRATNHHPWLDSWLSSRPLVGIAQIAALYAVGGTKSHVRPPQPDLRSYAAAARRLL